jgi:hypothetical protein
MIYLYLAGLVASFLAGFFVAKNNYSVISTTEAQISSVVNTVQSSETQIKNDVK